ncbi:DUF1643 domain-containing protein [Mobiluncus porci]|uniref:DUF1643 domain-containing protein n=1 Tax=Mobiluncus porci TaxID=2652278 RepID=A0A7K0K3Z0_9ACTO|nr:DUF1643 domain-containing protein [Mobiluncus porci]MST50197.1 DUF1643 domain-containing protein [Mobiluncus porci]
MEHRGFKCIPFSDGRFRYRYDLIKNQESKPIIFIGLNPSKGGTEKPSDRTIDKFIDFVTGKFKDDFKGFTPTEHQHILICNLFLTVEGNSTRLGDEELMEDSAHKIAVEILDDKKYESAPVVCCWGNVKNVKGKNIKKNAKTAIDNLKEHLKRHQCYRLSDNPHESLYFARSWSSRAGEQNWGKPLTEIPKELFEN